MTSVISTAKLIAKSAELARLELTDAELERFSSEIEEILRLFSILDEVDVKNMPVSVQPVTAKVPLRGDEPAESLTQSQALSNTVHKENGYFKSPRIL